VNQKIMLKHKTTETTTVLVRKVNPDGSALAFLNKKICTRKYVGATATVAAPSTITGGARVDDSTGASLPSGVEPNSSAHERIKHKGSIRVGAGLMFIPGFTVAGGYNFTHDFGLEATVDKASVSVLGLFGYERLRLGGLANYFVANSFHFSGGMVFEKFSNSSLGGTTSATGSSISADAFKGSINQLQIQVGLGSRWNLNQFVIGSEWVGYSKPVFNMSESFTRIEGYSDVDFEESKRTTLNFVSTGSFRLLNCYIGISF